MTGTRTLAVGSRHARGIIGRTGATEPCQGNSASGLTRLEDQKACASPSSVPSRRTSKVRRVVGDIVPRAEWLSRLLSVKTSTPPQTQQAAMPVRINSAPNKIASRPRGAGGGYHDRGAGKANLSSDAICPFMKRGFGRIVLKISSKARAQY